ncbi:sigma-70 family RNA polymerase sigma factor [Agathobaculum butyriciproducens]|nr:sigma-70 family RNA polymerase sigma factor [Agathobaculum butyriciproducens]RGC61099.1 sigma-70 family RNA polymerase sigma factor [Agathobaculum butyriciproducens]
MTEKQQFLVERIVPYIDYMLARKIPYVPPRLWEDCRSVALLTLCEYAAKQDDEDAVWFPEFAFKRMKDAVIKYILTEKKYSDDLSVRHLSDKCDAYFKTGEERISDMADIEVIIRSSEKRKNFYEIFDLLSEGYTVKEIAEKTHMPPQRIHRLIREMRKDYHNFLAG